MLLRRGLALIDAIAAVSATISKTSEAAAR
jgi:hypothetical protein